MAEKKITSFSLPRELGQWQAARKKHNCGHMNIHNLDTADSGSELAFKQYLTLKVLWISQKQNQTSGYLAMIGFEPAELHQKEKDMLKRKAWELYLRAVAKNENAIREHKPRPWTIYSHIPDEFGGFQLAFRDQLEIIHLPEEPIGADVNKVTVTPMQLRPRKAKGPSTPQPQSVSETLQAMSATQYDELKLPDAKDEQIVNSALMNLLHSLWMDEKRKSNWTIERKEFQFRSEGTGAGFVARTDGHLQVRNQSAAILEVKARARPRKDPGVHKIEMQESAQMALWIAQEPESHWTSSVPETSRGGKGKQRGETTIYHRVLISQDHHEIYMTIAEYTQQYIDYLLDRNGVTISDDFFLRMHTFGEFDIKNASHMKSFGVLVKVILTHAANAIQTSSSRSSSNERAGPVRADEEYESLTRTMKDISIAPKQPSSRDFQDRARNEPQARLPRAGQQHTGSGRGPSRSPSRSGSPYQSAESQFRRQEGSLMPSSYPHTPQHRHRSEGLRPLSPNSAGRQFIDYRGYSENEYPSGNHYNSLDGRDARPISPYPQPPERTERRGGTPASSTTSRSSSMEPPASSAARRYRSHDEDAIERPRGHRSRSNSRVRYDDALGPSSNRGSSARGASSGHSSLHPHSTSRSDYRSSDRYY